MPLISVIRRSFTSIPLLFAKPTAALVGWSLSSYAVETGGPLRRSTCSDWVSLTPVTINTRRRGVAYVFASLKSRRFAANIASAFFLRTESESGINLEGISSVPISRTTFFIAMIQPPLVAEKFSRIVRELLH